MNSSFGGVSSLSASRSQTNNIGPGVRLPSNNTSFDYKMLPAHSINNSSMMGNVNQTPQNMKMLEQTNP